MAEALSKPVRVYPYGLDSNRPGFVVESGAWLKTVLPTIYRKLEDRRAEGGVQTFPAHFVF
jgi:hypothetical protein